MAEGTAPIEWCWLALSDMEPGLLYRLLAFRESVFVVEQRCAYQELDGRDERAWHLVGLRTGHVVACLRVLVPQREEGRFRIGRVAVDSGWRGKGLARQMVLMALDRIREHGGTRPVVLDAQTYLVAFYGSLGFEVTGEEFLEDGIPHRPMALDWERAPTAP
ncbi:GNAT family N-acetyltransferase [Elongatibacter sediminis]|uniref:GNAT family N-acetyltransferase n=1 Tax=Elongatibacter sediminis TaxID=3119006 RepID=A0AAW9RB27_9GAMM